MNNIIIIKKIQMCRIGHSSALCGRIVAPRIDVLPYKAGNHSNAGKQTPRSPIQVLLKEFNGHNIINKYSNINKQTNFEYDFWEKVRHTIQLIYCLEYLH